MLLMVNSATPIHASLGDSNACRAGRIFNQGEALLMTKKLSTNKIG